MPGNTGTASMTGTSGTCFDKVNHENKVSSITGTPSTPGKTGNVLSTAAHDQVKESGTTSITRTQYTSEGVSEGVLSDS